MSNLYSRYLNLLFNIRKNNFLTFIDKHDKLYQEATRSKDYTEAANHYYQTMAEIIEVFYGPSWQFCPPQYHKQPRSEAIKSLHQTIARMIQHAPGKCSLDMGCGLGGALQEISTYSGGKTVGVSLSEEECKEANLLIKQKDLEKLCNVVQGNSLQLPFSESSFDSTYSIYSFKYLPSHQLKQGFSEAFRVLKPGGSFLLYDAILTKQYNPDNAEHSSLAKKLTYLTAMPPLHNLEELLENANQAGFQLVTQLNLSQERKWFHYFVEDKLLMWSVSSKIVPNLMKILEKTKALSEGFTKFYRDFLADTVNTIVELGKKDLVTFSQILVFKKNN